MPPKQSAVEKEALGSSKVWFLTDTPQYGFSKKKCPTIFEIKDKNHNF